jgi:hypothetical protein
MPKLFGRYGYRWLDFRDARSIPCRQSDFVDGGYHTDAACSMRMRRRLDAAARRQLTLVALGDSIPAARPRECHCRAGFVALFARALRRPVAVRNLAVPGANSADVLRLLRKRGGVHADTALVMVGTTTHRGSGRTGRCGGTSPRSSTWSMPLTCALRTSTTTGTVTQPSSPNTRAPICEVARSHGARCADVYHAFTPRLLAADHVHPNATGQRLIARLLYALPSARRK